MSTTISRWIETSTGHRIPHHRGKCRNLHGHCYRWEIEVEGTVVEEAGVSDEGMLMDFSVLSALLKEHIYDVVDHAFVLYEGDERASAAMAAMGPDHRTVKVPFIPTAENLARWAYEKLAPHIKSAYGNELRLAAVYVRETSSSSASWRP